MKSWRGQPARSPPFALPLDETAFEAAWVKGQALGTESAIEEALAAIVRTGKAVPVPRFGVAKPAVKSENGACQAGFRWVP